MFKVSLLVQTMEQYLQFWDHIQMWKGHAKESEGNFSKELNFMKGLFCEEDVVKFLGTDLTPAEIHMWAVNGVQV